MSGLRALKTDEEIALVPLAQPILVELPGGVIDADGEGDGGLAQDTKTGTDDNGAKALQTQLEAMQAAQRASDDRAAKAERDRDDARREAREATQRATALEGDVITGGLSAAQGDLAAAEAELERAGEAGDFKAMAKAQAKIGRASAQIVNLEGGAAEVAERIEKKPAQVQQQAAPIDPIAGIDANPNLFPAEKAWLKAHPDAVTDNRRNNELGVGYERAMKQGLTRGTPDYFAFLEDFMGYAKASTDHNDNGSTSVQAPPHRNDRGGDGRPAGNKIQLDPEERLLASNMGISETDYARNKQRMQSDMKANPEKYGVR